METVIRIGTRDSALALWQAKAVQRQLEALHYRTSLVPVKATGDILLETPLYELGVTGIFTKTLDIALLNDTIDIAVHSMKDVPTQLPEGIVQAAVLERANPYDILVPKTTFNADDPCTIATGSLRRKAQWLHKYPHHTVVNLRGNVNTRLQKLKDNNWCGAIFAKAGLERIDVLPKNHQVLNWMVPAPAQGAIMIATRTNSVAIQKACVALDHHPTAICMSVEREFLRTLEGGCTAPIGGLASIEKDTLHFEGVLFALDGTEVHRIKQAIPLTQAEGFGKTCAQKILQNGGDRLMERIKNSLSS